MSDAIDPEIEILQRAWDQLSMLNTKAERRRAIAYLDARLTALSEVVTTLAEAHDTVD